MNQHLNANDLTTVVENDKAHIWHHLSQHAPYEKIDPRIIVEGKGMRVWDQHGKEHIDAVSGGVWTVNVGYGRESIANAVMDQLIKLNYFWLDCSFKISYHFMIITKKRFPFKHFLQHFRSTII